LVENRLSIRELLSEYEKAISALLLFTIIITARDLLHFPVVQQCQEVGKVYNSHHPHIDTRARPSTRVSLCRAFSVTAINTLSVLSTMFNVKNIIFSNTRPSTTKDISNHPIRSKKVLINELSHLWELLSAKRERVYGCLCPYLGNITNPIRDMNYTSTSSYYKIVRA